MKFARYLAENLTPEWKRAYIDYRECKKRIKICAQRLGQISGPQEGDEKDTSDADDDHGPSAPPRKSPSVKGSAKSPGIATGSQVGDDQRSTPRKNGYGSTMTSPKPMRNGPTSIPPLDIGESSFPDDTRLPVPPPSSRSEDAKTKKDVAFSPHNTFHNAMSPPASPEESPQRSSEEHQTSDSAQPLNADAGSSRLRSPRTIKSPKFTQSPRYLNTPKAPPSPIIGNSPVGKSPSIGRKSISRSFTMPSPRPSMRTAQTFEDLYETLEEDEQSFFDFLQHELEKVDAFYQARGLEAQRRGHDLRIQLRELAEHRKVFHELYPEGMPEWEAAVGRMLPVPTTQSGLNAAAQKLLLRIPFTHDEDHSNGNGTGNGKAKEAEHGKGTENGDGDVKTTRLREAMAADKEHQTYNPERYQKYKKELKQAVLEYYRYLELIKNYRIMNFQGFRKALKKFEKATKVHCMEMYTDEKIVPESFAKADFIDGLIKQTEEMYTEHFEHGDSKRARDQLRLQTREKTHYQSVFRSGMYMGLGLPAAIFALVQACSSETEALIPNWDGLLQIYGALYLPVIFGLLFELNLRAYVQARINYEFVMELSRPTIDHRSFIEIPAFLFFTLSYCFFFSYYRVGASNVAPTTWPAAWLVFVVIFFLNPLPNFRRQSRWWLLRVLFRVMTPGYSRVEFIAFFLADELNSLIYTIQNFYFIGCVYGKHWPNNVFSACPSGKAWPYALFLCLPALSRLIQCLKRWYDSRLGIHLINAGKYLSVILQQCLFVVWRSRGSQFHDASFIVWIIVATISATYACTWDIVVDWSLFRPKAGFLRHDLGYSNPRVYYFAMITNALVRFVFVWYVPASARHTRTRSFFFALAEMLRRWQWNFFRVETEHLGNADAYRVTREIPLPYRRVDRESDDEDEVKRVLSRASAKKKNPMSVRLSRFKRGLVGSAEGRGPEALNVGARGHAPQRDYEARRPGDIPREPSTGTTGV